MVTGAEFGIFDWTVLGAAIAVMVLYTVLRTLWPLLEVLRHDRENWRKELSDALEALLIPLVLAAIFLLSFENHKAIGQAGDDLAKDIEHATKRLVVELANQSYKVEVFPDTTSFFEDLKAESLRESVRNSYVTLIRHATNEEFPDSDAVDAYYDSVMERCRSDEKFTLWRVLGVTNENMLLEAKVHAREARHLPNYEYRVFRWSQQHSPINLVVLEDDQGPNIAYIIVPPSSKARLQTIKLSNAREIARFLKHYHATLFAKAVEPTEENLLEIEGQL